MADDPKQYSPQLPDPLPPPGAETGPEPCFRRDWKKARRLRRVPLRVKKTIRRRLRSQIGCEFCILDVPVVHDEAQGFHHQIPGWCRPQPCPDGAVTLALLATYRDDYDWTGHPEAAGALANRR